MSRCSFCYIGEYNEFISKNGKKILMCPDCGCIEIPYETMNKEVVDYHYNGSRTFMPIIDRATFKQVSYLMTLAQKLEIEVDTRLLTKNKAAVLISNFIERLKEKGDPIVDYENKRKTDYKKSADTRLSTIASFIANCNHSEMDKEYEMNHPFTP